MSTFSDNLTAYCALTRREIRRIFRIWTQSLIPPVITIILYYAIFGKLIGNRIGTIGHFNYMQYIVPGMVMMSVITSSYINSVSSFFNTKFQRSIEEMLIAPMSPWAILLGYITASIFRSLAVSALVLVIAMFFTQLHLVHPVIVLLSILLGALIFGLAGLINGVYARKFDDVFLMPTFVITPLIYLGGVFYSIHMLSEPWQSISLANPILYLVNTLRFGMLGISDVNVNIALIIMVAFTVILTIVAVQLLKRGIRLMK